MKVRIRNSQSLKDLLEFGEPVVTTVMGVEPSSNRMIEWFERRGHMTIEEATRLYEIYRPGEYLHPYSTIYTSRGRWDAMIKPDLQEEYQFTPIVDQ